MLGWCHHEWEVLDKTVLKSPREQCKGSVEMKPCPMAFFQKSVMVIVACKKCGKKDEHVCVNPPEQVDVEVEF